MTKRPEQVPTLQGRKLVAEYRKVAWSTRIEAKATAALRSRLERVLAAVRDAERSTTPAGAITAAMPPVDPFDLATWDQQVQEDVAPEATDVYAEISETSYRSFVGADATGRLSQIDTTPHLQSLVGRMQGLGPDTATQLGRSLNSGFAQGQSYADIAAGVQDVFDSTDARALMIARTEVTRAVEDTNASYASALDASGLTMTKAWLDSEGACPICEALAQEEPIGVNENFSDGSSQPPDPHPSCRCSLAYDTAGGPVGSSLEGGPYPDR